MVALTLRTLLVLGLTLGGLGLVGLVQAPPVAAVAGGGR